MMACADEVLVERRGPVLIARLNRPAKRNAINRALSERLIAAVEMVENDPALRVGVLISATRGMFCAGADLAALAAGELSDSDGTARPSFTRIERAKPWIAAVDGAVLGGGLEMALACEMIVAGEDARLGLPEAQRGLIAAGGGVFRLPRAIPRAIAMEMLLTGQWLDARRALALGLVNRVVPAEAIETATVELAEAVAACAPGSIRESLAIARAASGRPEAELWPLAREALARLLAEGDAKEGMDAFLNRRSPAWGVQ